MKASHPILREHLFQLNKSVLFFKVDVTVHPKKVKNRNRATDDC